MNILPLSTRRAFTLIELLITIGVLAALAVFVVTLLNPTEYINRSKDATRASELQSINSAIALYARDNTGGLGTKGVAYLSLIDPNATTTAGTDCSGLGFPAGGTYHCAASSTARNVDGTGWIPVNLAKISGGSPLSQYPVDPVNSSSSGEYYAYSTNGVDWSIEAFMQSSKYSASVANEESSLSSATYEVGNAGVPTVLYGVNGSIFSINTATGAYNSLYDLGSTQDGQDNDGSLTPYNGLLYGTSYDGGSGGYGTLFSYNPSTGVHDSIYTFDISGGGAGWPSGALLPYDGLLYGTAQGGGANNDGAIFALNPSNNTVTVVHSFSGADGQGPYYSTLIPYDGLLYGTTASGGIHSNGVIFSINPSDNSYTKLHDFSSASDGSSPSGLVAYDGLLYGLGYQGGANGYGTIFSFDPSKSVFTDLHDFTASDGKNPVAGLVEYGGILYGNAYSGGAHNYGTVFSFDPSKAKFTNIHDFAWTDGANPLDKLTAYNGMLYGITDEGETSFGNTGVVFSINLDTNAFAVVYGNAFSYSGLTQFVR